MSTHDTVRNHRPLGSKQRINAGVERKEVGGREYLVFPIIALREMVIDYPENGTRELLPKENIAETVHLWAGTPLTYIHPENAQKSADTPESYTQEVIGQVFKPQIVDEEKLRVEAWLDIEKANAIGGLAQSVLEKLENGENLSVSAGYATLDDEFQSGKYNGEDYDVTQGILLPDHVAVFPSDEFKARISWEDGAGAPRMNFIELDDGPEPGQFDESRRDDPRETPVLLGEDVQVGWLGNDGVRYGRVVDTIEAGETYGETNDGEAATRGPAALVEVYEPQGNGWQSTGEMAEVQSGFLTVIDTFGDDIVDPRRPGPANAAASESASEAIQDAPSTDTTMTENAGWTPDLHPRDDEGQFREKLINDLIAAGEMLVEPADSWEQFEEDARSLEMNPDIIMGNERFQTDGLRVGDDEYGGLMASGRIEQVAGETDGEGGGYSTRFRSDGSPKEEFQGYVVGETETESLPDDRGTRTRDELKSSGSGDAESGRDAFSPDERLEIREDHVRQVQESVEPFIERQNRDTEEFIHTSETGGIITASGWRDEEGKAAFEDRLDTIDEQADEYDIEVTDERSTDSEVGGMVEFEAKPDWDAVSTNRAGSDAPSAARDFDSPEAFSGAAKESLEDGISTGWVEEVMGGPQLAVNPFNRQAVSQSAVAELLAEEFDIETETVQEYTSRLGDGTVSIDIPVLWRQAGGRRNAVASDDDPKSLFQKFLSSIGMAPAHDGDTRGVANSETVTDDAEGEVSDAEATVDTLNKASSQQEAHDKDTEDNMEASDLPDGISPEDVKTNMEFLSMEDLAQHTMFSSETLEDMDEEMLMELEKEVIRTLLSTEGGDANGSDGEDGEGGSSTEEGEEMGAEDKENTTVTNNETSDAPEQPDAVTHDELEQRLNEFEENVVNTIGEAVSDELETFTEKQRENAQKESDARIVANAIDGMSVEAAKQLPTDELEHLAKQHGGRNRGNFEQANMAAVPGEMNRNYDEPEEDLDDWPGGREDYQKRNGQGGE